MWEEIDFNTKGSFVIHKIGLVLAVLGLAATAMERVASNELSSRIRADYAMDKYRNDGIMEAVKLNALEFMEAAILKALEDVDELVDSSEWAGIEEIEAEFAEGIDREAKAIMGIYSAEARALASGDRLGVAAEGARLELVDYNMVFMRERREGTSRSYEVMLYTAGPDGEEYPRPSGRYIVELNYPAYSELASGRLERSLVNVISYGLRGVNVDGQ